MEGQGPGCTLLRSFPPCPPGLDEGQGDCAALRVSTGGGPTAPAAWASTQSPWVCPWGLSVEKGSSLPRSPSEASRREGACHLQ